MRLSVFPLPITQFFKSNPEALSIPINGGANIDVKFNLKTKKDYNERQRQTDRVRKRGSG